MCLGPRNMGIRPCLEIITNKRTTFNILRYTREKHPCPLRSLYLDVGGWPIWGRYYFSIRRFLYVLWSDLKFLFSSVNCPAGFPQPFELRSRLYPQVILKKNPQFHSQPQHGFFSCLDILFLFCFWGFVEGMPYERQFLLLIKSTGYGPIFRPWPNQLAKGPLSCQQGRLANSCKMLQIFFLIYMNLLEFTWIHLNSLN